MRICLRGPKPATADEGLRYAGAGVGARVPLPRVERQQGSGQGCPSHGREQIGQTTVSEGRPRPDGNRGTNVPSTISKVFAGGVRGTGFFPKSGVPAEPINLF